MNQGELYTVTHAIKYDVLTPKDSKGNNANICTYDCIMQENLECLDIFIMDIVTTHLNTTDKHATDESIRFNIPALFGDDFAYTNASHNFKFINKLAELLEKHSLEKFGV